MKYTMAEISEPKSRSWPLTLTPSPFSPPPAALTSGVMMAPVNVWTRTLKASAIDRPTATTTSWPCMRKFLKPLTVAPFPGTKNESEGRYELDGLDGRERHSARGHRHVYRLAPAADLDGADESL